MNLLREGAGQMDLLGGGELTKGFWDSALMLCESADRVIREFDIACRGNDNVLYQVMSH